MAKDGKGAFYRKLELDKRTMKLIRDYRFVKKMIDRDVNIKTEEQDVRETDGR